MSGDGWEGDIPHMAFCLASVESAIVSVGPLSLGSWLMCRYGGTSMDSSPSGPLMCTVDMGWTRDPLPFADGAVTLKVTPGGTDSGAEPILDAHGAVELNGRAAVVRCRAGSRNVGIESVGCSEAAMRWAQRRRAGANMARYGLRWPGVSFLVLRSQLLEFGLGA
jgi:hypothetical protein